MTISSIRSTTELAMEKFDELAECGLLPDDSTYISIILGYCREERVEKGFEFYNESINHSFKPDRFTYKSIITTPMEDGKLSEAEELLEKVSGIKGETEKNPTITTESKEELNTEAVVYSDVINELCSRGRNGA